MNFVISSYLKKQTKLYFKKHKNLLNDIILTLKNFDKENSIFLGANTYKIRLKSSDINKGKRSSFRLVILILKINNIISPVALYFKGNRESISKKEIMHHAKLITKETNEN